MFYSILLTLLIAVVPCAPHSDIVEYLQKEYGESVAVSGVTKDGYLFEFTVNEEKGTWTVLLTKPMGLTCLIEAGNGWQERKLPLGEKDA